MATETLEALEATGTNKISVFINAVLPASFAQIIAWTGMRLETNFSECAILGMVGAGGVGFIISRNLQNYEYGTAAHAMSYKLTSLYGVPHGRAVFMCLPHIWRYMNEKHVLPRVFAEIAKVLGYETVDESIDFLMKLDSELFKDDEVVMDINDLEVLTISVNPIRLKNNPLALSENEISNLYKKIMEKHTKI